MRKLKLTDYDLKRYDRQIRIFGRKGQEALKSAKVLVAGVGGLGSPCSIYLAAAGVGHIRLVDDDRIELSNLNRQILHWDRDIGRKKAESACEKLRQINPSIKIEAVCSPIDEGSIERLAEGMQAIVDGMDNFPSRYVLNRAAINRKIPFFHGSVYGLEGRVTTILPGKTACLRCVFPKPPPKATSPVLGATPALVAAIQAMELVKYFTGKGSLLAGRMLIYDGENSAFEEVKLEKNPKCPDCGR